MRKLSIAVMAAVGALFAGPAMAADVNLPPALLKGPLPIAHVYNWTGCYLGVQAGGGFMHDSNVDSSSDPIFHGGGAIAGGQAGCNYQMQQLVVGIEGEGWWSGLKNKSTDNSTSTITDGITTATNTHTSVEETKNRWDAAVSLRAGWAVDRLLFYGKAGAVAGGFNFSNNFSDVTTCGGPFGCGTQTNSSSGSKTLVGMLLGFGFEYAFLENWIFRMEADYLNFPRTDVPATFSNSCCGGPGTTVQTGSGTFSQFASKGLLKAGVSFKFP